MTPSVTSRPVPMRVATCSTLRSARIAWRRSEAAVEAAELVGPFGPVGPVGSAGPVESVEKGDMWFLLFAGDGNGGFCPGEPR